MAILDPLKKNQYTTTGMPATTQASQGTAAAKPTGGGVSQGQAQTYKAATGTAQTYKPVERDVKSNETVQSQLSNILGENSAYLQRARENANQTMNGRGLYSSSMAVGAAEGAAIDRAMPIAQQDAATYAQRAGQNLASVNDAGQFNANAQNTMTGINLNAQNTAAQVNAGNIQQMTLSNMDALNQDRALGRQIGSQEKMQSLDIRSRESMQGNELRHQRVMQSDQINNQRLMQSRELDSSRQLLTQQLSSQEYQADLNRKHDQTMSLMDTQSKARLVRYESEYKRAAQQDISVTQIYGQSMDSMSQVFQNTSLTGPQQQAAANTIMDQMSSYMSFSQQLNGRRGPDFVGV